MLLRSKSSAQYAQAQRIAARRFYRDYAVIGQAGGETRGPFWFSGPSRPLAPAAECLTIQENIW